MKTFIKIKSKIILTVFVTAFICNLTSCYDPTPMKISLLAPFSGTLQDIGWESTNAVTLGVEQINNSGGINKRKLKLFVEEITDDVQTGIDAIHKRHIESFIIGPYDERVLKTVHADSWTHAYQMIIPSIYDKSLLEINDYIINTGYAVSKWADKIFSLNPGKKIAIIYNSKLAGFKQNLYQEIKIRIKPPETILVYEFDTSSLKKQIPAINAETLIFLTEAEDIISYCKKVNPKAEIFAVLSFRSPLLKSSPCNNSSKFKILTPEYNEQSNTILEQFHNKYIELYKTVPGSYAVDAYDALFILKAGYKTTKQQRNNEIIEGIVKKEYYSGAGGKFRINKYGDIERKITICEIKNGEYLEITGEK